MDETKLIPFFNLQKNLLLILPISLIFSIFIADLIVTILFFIFIYYLIIKRNFKILDNIYFKIFFCFWLYIVSLSLFSENILISLKSSFFYIRFITLPLIIFLIFKYDDKIKKLFFYILGLIILILFCDSFFQFMTGKNIIGYGIIDNRVSSFFGDEKILGSYISRIFFIFAGLWFIYFKLSITKNNIFFLIFLILSLTTIIISGDRMPLLVFIFCVIILFLSIKIKLSWRILYISFLILMISLPLILSKSIYERLVNRTLLEAGSEKILSDGVGYKIEIDGKENITFFTQQQNFLYTSINMIKAKFLFGHSNKGYKLSCKNYALDKFSCPSHPHNTYLQIFVENGLVGFIFISSIFFYLTYILLKNFINLISNKELLNISEICFILALYLNLWPLAQTGNFYNNWLSIIYYIPIAFVLKDVKT
tara:strand:- start:197 stop:1468 length:1272 start_codon:yes stop_codon:yes gene_type:complete